MEIEVKLRLPNKASHQKLLQLLSPFRITTHHQHNTFFDGLGSELSSHRAVLRLRFHEQTNLPKCFICLKAKAVITNGVSRVEVDGEEVDPSIGYACLEEPGKLMTNSLALLEDGAIAVVLLGFAPPSTLLPASSSKLNEVPILNPFHRPQSGFMIDVTSVEDSQLMVGSANLHLTLVLWLWS
ncbi:triphosphate tunel metalloenzyme 3-like isoform X1 [Olea europaea subsp. europaea]|uniref:Triphosphate tunel metalloenzyme 3-like isoform X1 n=1 Tax=Olea europaea subsp. europaea TaxID=158383 RepID=A0A8S0QDZ2_OLEEU|nr:triphosphate tunel metalloenzyme 3-like isoform X1 [Olea europaea subsp. europaea]